MTKKYHNILDYAEHFRPIPLAEDMDGEYTTGDLVFHLVGKNDEHCDWLLKYLAHIVQKPWINQGIIKV